MSDAEVKQPRFRRAPIFRPKLVHGSRAAPGKRAAQEAEHLRTTSGVGVPRAAAYRLARRIVADTLHAVKQENARFARRLKVRGKRVPASLTVAPAFQWNISATALDDIVAFVELTAKRLGSEAVALAEHRKRGTISADDLSYVYRTLGK